MPSPTRPPAPIPPRAGTRPWGRWLALALPLVLGLALAHHRLSDLDLWLHDRAGTDILREHALPHRNTYSFTAPDQPWMDHEWLFQVAVSLAATGRDGPHRAEPWGLTCQLLVALLVVLLWLEGAGPRRGARLPDSRRAAALALPMVATLVLAWPRLVLRPELPSLVAFVLAVRWVGDAIGPRRAPAPERSGKPGGWERWRPLVSPWTASGRTFWLAVAWAQWHGFWLLVPALWLLTVLLWPAERRLATGLAARPAVFATPLGRAGPVIATLVAGAFTPNGPAGLLYPLQALGQLGGSGPDLRQLIDEMRPLLAAQRELGTTVLVFKVCLIWAALWSVASAGRVPLPRLALLAAGFAAALHAQRNLGFCAIAFQLAHAGYDPARPLWWARFRRLAGPARLATRLAPFCSLAAAAVIGAAWLPAIRSDRFYLREGVLRRSGTGVAATQFPFRLANLLHESAPGKPLRVANNVDAASTIIATRAGLVFIDGRTEAYPETVWREYETLKQGGDGALALLDRSRCDAVLLAHASGGTDRLLTTLLASPSWRLAEADETGVLFLPAPPDAAPPGNTAPSTNAATLRAAAARLSTQWPAASGGASAADRYLALGNLLRMAGLGDEAEALFRRGLAARADHPMLLHNYGNLLLRRGDLAGARERFTAALAANGHLIDSRLNLGVCLFQAGDFAGAAAQFATSARRAPSRIDAWVNLAEARLRLGDRAGARSALQRAVTLRPDDAQLRRRLALLGG